MSTEEIRGLFPATVQITQDIIDNARIGNIYQCIGALALKSISPEELNTRWGVTTGKIGVGDVVFNITTVEMVSMMRISEPQEVTFIIKSELNLSNII